jgi:hypothetical protein
MWPAASVRNLMPSSTAEVSGTDGLAGTAEDGQTVHGHVVGPGGVVVVVVVVGPGTVVDVEVEVTKTTSIQ